MVSASPCNFAFGPFTFDRASRELVRNGQRLRIAEQASSLLTILLERAGTVVTREELRRLMWPNGEYLNHDHSISNAVNQLRTILRDNSRTPAFIETIPKKGYRFVAPVQTLQPAADLVFLPPVKVAEATAQTGDNPPANSGPALTAVPPIGPDTAGTILETDPLLAAEFSIPRELAFDRSTSLRATLPVTWTASRKWQIAVAALAFLLALVVAIGWEHRRSDAPKPDIYIGVAPFEASGPGADQLAESFRLDLADAISQLPGIQVRADHSFSDTRRDLSSVRNVAQTLQLDVLLYGKFTLDGDRCDLQFELVRGRDAIHLGSFRFSGSKDELASIRNQVQREVFARLETAGQSGGRLPGSSENTRAYQDYLQARYDLLQPTNDSLNKAVQAFQSAVALDPEFAKAYAGLATAYMLEAEHATVSPGPAYDQAKKFASKAIHLDPAEGEAHATLGFIAFRRNWDTQTGEHELRQAIALEPNQAIHHVLLALLLCNTGHFNESFREIEAARADDPLWPPIYLTEMYAASSARQNAHAIATAQKLLGLMPDWPLAHDQAGWTYWYAGHNEEAIQEWRLMASLEKDSARVNLEDRGLEAFHHGGVRAYARIRLDAIHSGTKWLHPNDFEPAEWYLSAGEREPALATIRAMIAHHDPDSLQLAVSPAYEDLHADPRFRSLLSLVGLSLPAVYPKDTELPVMESPLPETLIH